MSAGQSPVFRQPHDVKLAITLLTRLDLHVNFPVIRVYDITGSMIEIHECAGDFKEW
jgi:hypothetical protein